MAANMIVTVKFQGSNPSWTDLDEAIRVAQSHGYCARAKHFFNNKHEVTLMLYREEATTSSLGLSTCRPIPAFYKPLMSSTRQS